MSYHQLTPVEIIQLGHEYENLHRWQGVREFVAMLFGPNAQEVMITIVSEYNDSRYDDDVRILVYDAQKKSMFYDTTLPWWSQFAFSEESRRKQEQGENRDDGLERLNAYFITANDLVTEALANLFYEKVGLKLIENGSDHDPVTLTFDLTTPPPISFPQVYIAEL